MLVYWIPSTKNTLPINATHRVGVGAFVMNDKREVGFVPCIFLFLVIIYRKQLSGFSIFFDTLMTVDSGGSREDRKVPGFWSLETSHWRCRPGFKERFILRFI